MRLVTEDILGYRFTTGNLTDCLEQMCSWLCDDVKNKYFVAANPHSLRVAMKDRLFSESIINADLVIPDGIGIVIASKILGGNIRGRITGNDIFTVLTNCLNKKGNVSYYFLGSTEGNLDLIKKKMDIEFPDVTVVGTFSPPFKDDFDDKENSRIIDAINKARPDVLWVGMTAPKQEKWVYLYRKRLDVKLIGPIGAQFDFMTCRVKRAPLWFLEHGLEWLWRLFQEPTRLWGRTLISAPKFLFHVFQQRFRKA